ncbi:MAG: GreA/GreB family elongation factor [Kofleriaceae bacterium]|nr:GreA/GreB family elongation factor [Kofleriaceae bacterium]MCL4227989.1 GreA/GreB family elongation factor [Myxococcales bacterium]
MRAPDKAALCAELMAQLEAALAAATAAHQATVEGATHAESRAESDKDTRALEQTYLARGQALRVVELQAALADLAAWRPRRFAADDAVALGAVVTVEEAGDRRVLFLAPAGGGNTLAGDVQVVTPHSPLGRALLGKQAGDDVELPRRSLEIVSVR